ncbi:MAG: NAD-dependent epimerase/dehydratase family protein [Actinomycetota bacterium]
MSRVLVTGAGGFVGSHVSRALVERGHQVSVLLRQGTGAERIEDLRGRVQVLTADLTDAGAVEAAVADAQPESCLHLAWYAEPGAYLRAAAENLGSLAGGANLLAALIRNECRRVVLGGTCLERSVEEPSRTVYAAAKRALHLVADRLTDSGLSAACAHLFYLYGPGEDPRRVIPSVALALLRGEQVGVTAGDQIRDYLYVTDVASGLCAVLESDLSGGVDVCAARGLRLREVLESIERETGCAGAIRFGARPYGRDELFEAVGDARALHGLGWQPTVGLTDGMARTVEWWRRRVAKGAEVGVG